MTPTGSLNPSVVNSAKYISSHFQQNLKSLNWEIEATLDNQTIDGFKNIEAEILTYRLLEENYLPLLENLKHSSNTDYGHVATQIYTEYVENESFYLLRSLSQFSNLFDAKKKKLGVKVGLD